MCKILFIFNYIIFVVVAAMPCNAVAQTEIATQAVAGGFFDSPFVVVAILALLQGMISRAGLGAVIIVAVVMPAIVMWGRVPGLSLQLEGVEYYFYMGMEFLKILACSLLAWGAGLAIHFGVLRLLSRK